MFSLSRELLWNGGGILTQRAQTSVYHRMNPRASWGVRVRERKREESYLHMELDQREICRCS